jgi:type I restriction enzyme S subunit
METMIEEKLSIDKTNWTPVKFGDVVFEPKESSKDAHADGIEHVVGLEHIEPENIHLKNSATLEESTTFTKRFAIGDVLFGRRRAYLKKAAQASFSGICSGDITVFRANEMLMPELLPFIVNNEKFFDYAVKHSAGGLSPRVKFKDLANYEFLLPPKDQQAQLAKLLWAMDEVIESEKATLECLATFNEVYAQNLLGIGAPPNQSWRNITLKELAPLQRGFDLPNKELVEGPYPVGYSNGIKNYHKDFKVEGPGVWTGRSGTIGNVFYTEDNYWPHNTSLWVTDFKGNHPKYIYHLYSKLHFEKRMTGTGVPTLNRNDIHKFKIAVPDLDKQVDISDKIDRIDNQALMVQEKLIASQSLQKSIINQVF